VNPFDERLFQLKIQPMNQRMHGDSGKCWARARAEVQRLGNRARLLPAFVEYQLEVLRKYLDEVDRLRREVWLLDGNTVTPEFIRNIVVPHVFTIIAARKGAIQHELELRTRRTGEHQRGGPILVSQMNRLQGELATRYEIEAIELAKQAVRRIPATNASSVVLAVHSESEPRNSPEDVNWPSAKAETWRDFREKFQALAGEEQGRATAITGGRALQRMDQVLRASCNYKMHPEGWERGKPEQGLICLLDTPRYGVWNYESDGVSENFRERVRVCVARTGVALGCPRGADPEDFWLHHLYLDLLANKSDLLFAASEEGGMILSVCVASATFCSRLEKKSLKQADMQKFEISQPGERLMTVTDILMPDAGLQEFGLQDFSLHRLEKVSDDDLLELLKRSEDQQDWLVQAIKIGQTDPDLERMDVVSKQLRKELARRGKLPSPTQNGGKKAEGVEIKAANTREGNERQLFVQPILEKKGWSTHRLAVEAEVDFHTANDYLKNKTMPNRTTRTQLAKALGIPVEQLPK